MTTSYEIPLTPQPQVFGITLAGTQYTLTVTWCDPNQTWILGIGDLNNNPIVQGIPLVTGINLLAPYSYLGIGGALYCSTDNNPSAPPTFTDLGQTGHLYFVTSP